MTFPPVDMGLDTELLLVRSQFEKGCVDIFLGLPQTCNCPRCQRRNDDQEGIRQHLLQLWTQEAPSDLTRTVNVPAPPDLVQTTRTHS